MKTKLMDGTRNAAKKYIKRDYKFVSGADNMINLEARMGGVPPKRTYYQADPSLQDKKS